MLVASSGMSEQAFEVMERFVVDTTPIGNTAKLFDPSGQIEGLQSFELRVTSSGYDHGLLDLCPGVIELPDGSLALSVPDAVPENIRPIIGCIHLLNAVDGQPVEKTLERAMRQVDTETRHLLANVAFFGLRQAYHALRGLPPEELYRQTRLTKDSTLFTHRLGSGAAIEFTERFSQLRKKLVAGHELELPKINEKLLLGDVVRAKGIMQDMEIRDISLTVEPARAPKAHFCRSCTAVIIPRSLRVTVGVLPNGSRFDHHHYHAGCAEELLGNIKN